MRTRVGQIIAMGVIGFLTCAFVAGWGAAQTPGPQTKPAGTSTSTSSPTTKALGKITIGKETTYVLGPLKADGTVNYFAALNEIHGKGVTKDNNAAILLIKALGPQCADEEVLGLLGLSGLPDVGPYLKNPTEFAAARYAAEDPEQQALRKKRLEQGFDAGMKGPLTSKNNAELTEWVQSNQAAYDLAIAATKRDRFFVPFPVNKEDTAGALFPMQSGQLRALARFLVIKAMLAAGDGEVDKAVEDILAVHRLAALESQTPTMIHCLVAVGVDALANSASQALIKEGMLSGKQAAKLQEQMQKLPPLCSFKDVLDGERLFGLAYLTEIAVKGLDAATAMYDNFSDKKVKLPEVELDYDLMLKEQNGVYDKYIGVLEQKDFAHIRSALGWKEADATGPGAWSNTRQRLLDAIKNNPKDKKARTLAVMAALEEPSIFPRVYELLETARAQRELTMVALAITQVKEKKKEYPIVLDKLAPEFIKALPADRFTGKPLVYRREGDGYILHSVGSNMKDDGGKGRADCKDPGDEFDDVVLKVEK